MMEAGAISDQFRACPLSLENPDLFAALAGDYGEIVQLAVQQTVSGTDRHIFPKLRVLAWRAGEADAVPQDLIAIHLSALALLVRTKPPAMVKACVRQSRLLLVKVIGELALYYRDQAARHKVETH